MCSANSSIWGCTCTYILPTRKTTQHIPGPKSRSTKIVALKRHLYTYNYISVCRSNIIIIVILLRWSKKPTGGILKRVFRMAKYSRWCRIIRLCGSACWTTGFRVRLCTLVVLDSRYVGMQCNARILRSSSLVFAGSGLRGWLDWLIRIFEFV